MEDVAQWVERQIVALMVAGSNPAFLPNSCAVTSLFGGMISLKEKAPSQALKRGKEPSFFRAQWPGKDSAAHIYAKFRMVVSRF